MGSCPYRILQDRFSDLAVDTSDIILEIGSERGEGSSVFFQNWAKTKNISFISVDVEHADRETIWPDIQWVVYSSGHEWCRDQLPTLGSKIKILYLDNFDWPVEDRFEQTYLYKSRGVDLTIENCQKEHRLQVEYCLPYFCREALVIVDDTWMIPDETGILRWTGKAATAIPLLERNGFQHYNDSEYGNWFYRK